MKSPDFSKPPKPWGRVVVVAWILMGALAMAFLPLGAWLKQFSGYILSLGWIAPFAYIAGYVACCVFLLPSIAFSMGVGPVFGFTKGLLLTIVAANLGGTAAFVLGRTVLRTRVERWAQDKPRFKAMDAAVERNGLMVVALLRLTPIFPFTFVNYLLALTRLPYWKFALGTFVGMLPLNAAFLYISCEAARVVDEAQQKEIDTLKLGLRIGGIVMTIAALAVISRISVRAIKEAGADIPPAPAESAVPPTAPVQ